MNSQEHSELASEAYEMLNSYYRVERDEHNFNDAKLAREIAQTQIRLHRLLKERSRRAQLEKVA